jgi:membrane protein DedA with SNARE-associated domain
MISSWIHQSLLFITQNPSYGYLFSFFISFLESLPIVGTIVPGSITMTAIGTLIGTGALPITPTFLSAIIGAFFGDFTGFLVGRLGEERIFNVWPFNKHKDWLQYGRDFFRKHGCKSVIIGRFIGPVRSAIPMIASLLGMSYFRFVIAGTCSATLWSLLYILPGYFLGRYSKEMTHAELAKWIATLLIILIIITALYIAYKAIIYGYQKHYKIRVENFWLELTQKSHFFSFFANKQQSSNALPLLLLGWLICLACFYGCWLLINSLTITHTFHNQAYIDQYIDSQQIFLQFNRLASINLFTITLASILAITATISVGLEKALQSWGIYLVIVLGCYGLLYSSSPKLFALVLENTLLWLPLAFCTFTKATSYQGKLTNIYIIYGILTLFLNGNTVILLDISINVWTLSWILSAISISLFSLLSFRLSNPDQIYYLDSIAIHTPFALCLLLLFFCF